MNRSPLFGKQNLFLSGTVLIMFRRNFSALEKVRLNSVLFGFMLIFAILITGCGGRITRCEIEGSVTVDGQPIKDGSITFQPLAGTSGPVVGASIADGQYKIEKVKGPVVGEYQIELTGRGPTGRKITTEVAGDKIETEEMKDIIPLKHRTQNDPMSKNSAIGREPLKANVVPGKNIIDFNLKND